MPYKATPIELSEEDRRVLESWVRSSTKEQRMVMRARIILAAAEGEGTNALAMRLGVRPATVSKWRTRFFERGLAGLQDAPRPGARRVYDEETEKRILALLDEPPPPGHAAWTGKLLSERLGDVSKHHVWRVLRVHGIHLQRRRSWRISTDPEFAPKSSGRGGS